jgi:FtsH-binding integral membrane protein
MADNEKSDSTAQPDGVVASAALIDFPNPDAWSGKHFLIALTVGLLLAGFVGVIAWSSRSGTSTSGDVTVGLFILLFLAVIVVGFALLARAVWRVDDVLAIHRDGSVQDIFSSLLVPSSFRASINLKRVVEAMAQQGRAGAVVRIAKPNRAAPIDPLIVPFEPIPLDESVPLFVGLEKHAGAARGAMCASQADDASADEGASRGVFRRRILLSGGWLMIAIFAFNAAIGGWESYRARHVTLNAVMWTVYFVVALVGVGGRGAWRSRQQWLLVPGGLASRRTRFRRRDWELHLFQRESSMLIVKNDRRHIWAAYVADGQTHQMARMTTREAVMLLRAWLSPLPTPPLERLSDLA